MLHAKVTMIGNSAGIILPEEVMHKLRIVKGDVLYFCETPEGYALNPNDQEFIRQMGMAEEIMRDERDILKTLAKL